MTKEIKLPPVPSLAQNADWYEAFENYGRQAVRMYQRQLDEDPGVSKAEERKLEALRDQFATEAANGMFAAFKHWPTDGEHLRVAEHAYRFADAMLKERTK